MATDIENYRRGYINLDELMLIALAEGYTIKRTDGGVIAERVH